MTLLMRRTDYSFHLPWRRTEAAQRNRLQICYTHGFESHRLLHAGLAQLVRALPS